MPHTKNSAFTSAYATITHWTATGPAWHKAATAGTAALLAIIAWRALVSTQRGIRRKIATSDEPMDPFTIIVTVMATALSIDGMWAVFGNLHLVTPARIVSCGVLEASGFAFMRLARNDIKAGRPATAHTVIVWALAILSGLLSAAASKSAIETIVRLVFPSLAVQLCHSWFLPIPTEVTLTQRQKGKRAWRYVKATRRVARARTPLSRWAAGQLLALESDRLTKRSLMTGDPSAVLDAAEQAATAEALAALGITPSAPEVHLALPAAPRARHRANRTYRPASERTDKEICDAVTAANQQATATGGAPMTARAIAREMRIGQDRARKILKMLAAGG